MFGNGVRSVSIVYCAGRENTLADALSRSPCYSLPAVCATEGEAQVSLVEVDIDSLLHTEPVAGSSSDFSMEQCKDPNLRTIIEFLEDDRLPEDLALAGSIAAQEPQFSLVGNVLHFIDQRQGHRKGVAVPSHLRERLLRETHGGSHGGHFSSRKLYNTMLKQW